jgi:hypothetical protein
MITDSTNNLSATRLNFFEKAYALIFSVLFHPVFISLYVVAFIVYLHPSAFSGYSESNKRQVMLIVMMNSVFYPLLTVMLLRSLGFIDSILLKTQKDRIIPLIACGIFYFWTYTVFHEQERFYWLLQSFFLGIFLAASGALLANIYAKISLHATGMGGWLGFFLVIMSERSMLMTWPLLIVILLTGLVCSSRLLTSDHKPGDLLLGLILGLLSQFVAAAITS